MIDKIKNFSKLEKGWNGYSAEPPSELSIKLAIQFYELLTIKPDIIISSAIGGIAFIWKELKIFIEINNRGIICSLDRNFDEPKIDCKHSIKTAFNLVEL